jgi:hypothetical protein
MIRFVLALSLAVCLSGCFTLFDSEPEEPAAAPDTIVGDDGLVLQTAPSTTVESDDLAPPPPADE